MIVHCRYHLPSLSRYCGLNGHYGVNLKTNRVRSVLRNPCLIIFECHLLCLSIASMFGLLLSPPTPGNGEITSNRNKTKEDLRNHYGAKMCTKFQLSHSGGLSSTSTKSQSVVTPGLALHVYELEMLFHEC